MLHIHTHIPHMPSSYTTGTGSVRLAHVFVREPSHNNLSTKPTTNVAQTQETNSRMDSSEVRVNSIQPQYNTYLPTLSFVHPSIYPFHFRHTHRLTTHPPTRKCPRPQLQNSSSFLLLLRLPKRTTSPARRRRKSRRR